MRLQLIRPMPMSQTVATIQAGVLAITCAVIGGGGLCLMTVWLLIRGGPRTGHHLQLLSHYFAGYSVTWSGSVVGLFYGALLGAIVGWSVGKIYNTVALLRQDPKPGA